MLEVANAGKDHRQVFAVAERDGVSIAVGASGLDDGGDSSSSGRGRAVIKGEERIRGQHATTRVLAGLLDGQFYAVDAVHLAGAD
ncbi:MAG: hypothetical protein JWN98_1879, partial [Abditibacteriota bacterium]|nr:hypothetical protein [Abditibacteriota bacterium]